MKKLLGLASSLLALTAAQAAPLVHTSDFIANGSRSAFVDFETLPAASGLGATHSQSGVNVAQINGETNDIWTTCGLACWYGNSSLSWYPSGGDFGWTEISRVGGGDFASVGLDIGSIVFGYSMLQYELLDNGVSVLLGSFNYSSGADGYLGFSGGGFDTIRLRASDTGFAGGPFGNGAFQALAIDNIELTGAARRVPEPGALALGGFALVAAALARRQRKSR